MGGFDPYFTSSYESDRKLSHVKNRKFNHHWKTFQALTHEQQAQRIDELLAKQKKRGLTNAELSVLCRWERKVDPMRRI